MWVKIYDTIHIWQYNSKKWGYDTIWYDNSIVWLSFSSRTIVFHHVPYGSISLISLGLTFLPSAGHVHLQFLDICKLHFSSPTNPGPQKGNEMEKWSERLRRVARENGGPFRPGDIVGEQYRGQASKVLPYLDIEIDSDRDLDLSIDRWIHWSIEIDPVSRSMNKRDPQVSMSKNKDLNRSGWADSWAGYDDGREREKNLRDGSGKVTSGSAHDFLPFA